MDGGRLAGDTLGQWNESLPGEPLLRPMIQRGKCLDAGASRWTRYASGPGVNWPDFPTSCTAWKPLPNRIACGGAGCSNKPRKRPGRTWNVSGAIPPQQTAALPDLGAGTDPWFRPRSAAKTAKTLTIPLPVRLPDAHGGTARRVAARYGMAHDSHSENGCERFPRRHPICTAVGATDIRVFQKQARSQESWTVAEQC